MKIFKKFKFILEVTLVAFAIFSMNSFASHLATGSDECSNNISNTKIIQACKNQTIYDILSSKCNDIYDTFYTKSKQ